MRNLIFQYRRIIFSATMIFLIVGCKDLMNIDPGKDLKLILNYKPADAYLEAQVKDAKTGALILTNINIEIIGSQSTNVINFEGEAKTNYTKKGPSIYLGLRNIVPTKEKPISFTVIVSADGYLTSSKEMVLSGVKNAPLSVRLVKLDNLPTGAAVNQNTVTTLAGTGMNQDKTLTVQNGNNSTIVEISKGTILQDSKGNVLTGELKTTIVAFDGNDKTTEKSLPGGNSVTLVKSATGASNVQATLIPISFANIEIKANNGSQVTNFSKPIDISFEIDPNTKNPKTKTQIKAGDDFSVYSYSSSTGKWTYEKEGKVVINSKNEAFVTFSVNHLTWFFIGYDYAGPNIQQIYLTLTVTGYVLDRSSGTELIFPEGQIILQDGKKVLLDPIIFYAGAGSTVYKSLIVFIPTDAIGIEIPYTLNGTRSIMKWNLGTLSSGSSGKEFPGGGIDFTSTVARNMFVTVTCENKCALEILPYNVGLEFLLTGANASEEWWQLGSVDYNPETKRVSTKVYLPDNYETLGRATAYPEYTTKFNTGTGDFTVPIVLPNTHPLCKCGK